MHLSPEVDLLVESLRPKYQDSWKVSIACQQVELNLEILSILFYNYQLIIMKVSMNFLYN